ncbi:MAG TPA: hypothetical protein VGT61_00395 [Thermomicrobiales bacterium]|jgi:mannan endo-1,4-beta-mannosidase|nr:hypothetical protein [Thermomicrobiales bacterium]
MTSPDTSPLATPIDPHTTPFVTRDGADLVVDGQPFHFSGPNIYWLGSDSRELGHPDRPYNPREFLIDSALDAAVATGAGVVRSHTLGISLGAPGTFEPELGQFDPEAFRSADYALAGAARRGIRMMIPLTDQWRYHHGGINTRTAWRGFPNQPEDATNTVNAINNGHQRAAEAHFYDDQQLRDDHKRYIANILDHVNPHTGLAWRDDPTILAWETGNEISTAYDEWTADIAHFIRHEKGAKQLIADGTASNRWDVHHSALGCEDVDIVGIHYYPVNVEWGVRNGRVARKAGKVFVVGEYDWRDLDATRALHAAAEEERWAGTLFWSIFPRDEQGEPIPHGDGFTVHVPGTDDRMNAAIDLFRGHGERMAALR